MKYIKLTRGEFAMVDDEDFERVNQHRWWCWSYKKCAKKYAVTRMKGCGIRISMHRFVLPHDLPQTDHENGNGLDNQKRNLRPCDRIRNGRNRNIQNHSSKFKGVSFLKRTKKWLAYIRVNKRLIRLGNFKNEIDAGMAYDKAALKYFGEFSRTNHSQGVIA